MIWEHAVRIGLGPFQRSHVVAFVGNNGTLVVERSGSELYPESSSTRGGESAYSMAAHPPRRARPVARGLNQHAENFVDCMRTRSKSELRRCVGKPRCHQRPPREYRAPYRRHARMGQCEVSFSTQPPGEQIPQAGLPAALAFARVATCAAVRYSQVGTPQQVMVHSDETGRQFRKVMDVFEIVYDIDGPFDFVRRQDTGATRFPGSFTATPVRTSTRRPRRRVPGHPSSLPARAHNGWIVPIRNPLPCLPGVAGSS